MTVTQVRLTEDEARRLGESAARSGETAEGLARRVVADFLTSHEPEDWRVGLRQACGIWADRTDLPDLRELRAEWDRHWPGEEAEPCS